jgi:RNA polymerase-interacting CarD/CdnL/TRCF family regulator
MKWLLRLFRVKEKLRLGDEVTSSNNFYSKGVCVITRIYDRKSSGERIKYCRLEFEHYGFKRTINVTYKSCKKVNLIG